MSLSELFTLVKMPRVSGGGQRAVTVRDFESDELCIGISGASISSYVLKPSPKLIWSYSIPPTFTFTSLETYGEFVYSGIFNKPKKQYLLQVVRKLENDSELLKEVIVGSRILDIKRTLNNIIVVSEQETTCFDKDLKTIWKSSSLYSAAYSRFIENDLLLIVEHNTKKTNLNFKLMNTQGHEMSSKIIEAKEPLKNLSFTYNEGTLYQYFNHHLRLYKIPYFQEYKTLDLTKLSITSPQSLVSLQSPAADRILLAIDSELFLVNTNFNIVSAQTTSLKSKIELLTTERSGDKLNNSGKELQAILLKDTELAAVTFSLDSNSLKDAMGKRYQPDDSKSLKKVPSVLNIKDEEVDFTKLLKSKTFEDDLLKCLNATKEYFTEDDRVVDAKFISKMVSYILEHKTALPEKAFTYLLTHPLFPTIEGLLPRLRSNPRLLRQAVVTANISIRELLEELNTNENDDIFKDVIARLLEFPREKLVFKDLDNFRIVGRIIALNYGYELVSLLIDSTGFFTWNEDLIEKLQKTLSQKITTLSSASKLVAVIEQVENKNLNTVSKVPVYSIEKLEM